MEFALPWPPTVNSYYRCVGQRVLISKKGRIYRKHVQQEIMTLKQSGLRFDFGDSRLRVCIYLHQPTAARIDIDNRLKALLDAMQNAGVYDSDSQIDQLCVSRSDIRKPGEAIVSIWVL